MGDGSTAARPARRKPMDVDKMLADLRQQLLLLDQAIQVLERLGASQPRRRSRPPKWLTDKRAEKRQP